MSIGLFTRHIARVVVGITVNVFKCSVFLLMEYPVGKFGDFSIFFVLDILTYGDWYFEYLDGW